MDPRQQCRVGNLWKEFHFARVTEVTNGSSEVEQRRATTHDQFAVLRIAGRQCAGKIRVQLDDVAVDAEFPRLGVVCGRRKNRVAHEEPEFLFGGSVRGKVISRNVPSIEGRIHFFSFRFLWDRTDVRPGTSSSSRFRHRRR